MESKSTVVTPPVETYMHEGQEEVEVKQIEYPSDACLGAVIQCGKIAPGQPEHAGSN